MSVNKVILLGNVGQIQIKSFDGQNGPRKCATFSLATSERYKDRNGNLVNNTDWHNIVSWNHAELCEKYVTKGTQLYIEGKLRTRSWEDKDGNTRYVTEILADTLQLLGKKDSSPEEQKPQPQAPVQQAQPQQQYQTTAMPYPTETDDSDLPF